MLVRLLHRTDEEWGHRNSGLRLRALEPVAAQLFSTWTCCSGTACLSPSLNATGATYPVGYGYDTWGRMASMTTFRDENGPGDTTRWQYDLATGLLTNKVYADGKGPAYVYDAAGHLTGRTWARGVSTAYRYAFDGADEHRLLGRDARRRLRVRPDGAADPGDHGRLRDQRLH